MDNKQLSESLVFEIYNEDASADFRKKKYEELTRRIKSLESKKDTVSETTYNKLMDKLKKEKVKYAPEYMGAKDMVINAFRPKSKRHNIEDFRERPSDDKYDSKFNSVSRSFASLLKTLGFKFVKPVEFENNNYVWRANATKHGVVHATYNDCEYRFLISPDRISVGIGSGMANYIPDECFSADICKAIEKFKKSIPLNDNINKNQKNWEVKNPDKKSSQHEAAMNLADLIYNK